MAQLDEWALTVDILVRQLEGLSRSAAGSSVAPQPASVGPTQRSAMEALWIDRLSDTF